MHARAWSPKSNHNRSMADDVRRCITTHDTHLQLHFTTKARLPILSRKDGSPSPEICSVTIEFRPHRHDVSSKKSSFVPVCPSGTSRHQPINMLQADNLAATNNFLHIASKTRSRIPLQMPRRSWSLPRRPAFCCGVSRPKSDYSLHAARVQRRKSTLRPFNSSY